MRSSRRFACLFIVIALAAPLVSSAAEEPASKRRPNFVFIYADDFGWSDLGCYGHPYARTPNLDRLAQEGTRFLQYYSTGVTCCPARTGIMSGKFPATYRLYPAEHGFGDRPTVTDLLKQAGYRTGHFGKWHIGPEETSGTYGIDAIGDESRVGKAKQRRETNGRDAPIFDDAIRFVEQNRDAPFYVNVWGHISHHPVSPPESYFERFADVVIDETKFAAPMQEKFTNCRNRGGDVGEHVKQYLADVHSMDDDVGRLLRKIDELGLRENTIVIFSSDQGPAPLPTETPRKRRGNKQAEDVRLNAMGYVGELRGGKHTMYEGGVRVPFLVRWPGQVPVGRVDSTSVTGGIDWLPTICALAGVAVPLDDLDGEDASAAWLGREFTRTKPLVWKTNNVNSDLAIRSETWKFHLHHRQGMEPELFDLAADPGERNNVADKHPEVVERLIARLQQWNASLPKDYVHADDKND